VRGEITEVTRILIYEFMLLYLSKLAVRATNTAACILKQITCGLELSVCGCTGWILVDEVW
jgi:hypothetical protein